MEHKHSPAPSDDGLSLGSSPAVSRSPSPEVGRRAQSPSPELSAALDLTAEGVSVARTLRRCSEGSLRSSFESDTSELAPPNSSEGGGRDEEMGV